jgi:two-component system, NtrC family, response regulator AtoC
MGTTQKAIAFQPLALVDNRNAPPAEDMKAPLPRFLIVDDDESVREIFARLLRAEGYTVRAAATADAGLEAVAEWHPDAILLDYRMPFVNGLGFLYRLRTHESTTLTPVAVITAVDDHTGALSMECAKLGVAVYFKPIDGNELRHVARKLLNSDRAAR